MKKILSLALLVSAMSLAGEAALEFKYNNDYASPSHKLTPKFSVNEKYDVKLSDSASFYVKPGASVEGTYEIGKGANPLNVKTDTEFKLTYGKNLAEGLKFNSSLKSNFKLDFENLTLENKKVSFALPLEANMNLEYTKNLSDTVSGKIKPEVTLKDEVKVDTTTNTNSSNTFEVKPYLTLELAKKTDNYKLSTTLKGGYEGKYTTEYSHIAKTEAKFRADLFVPKFNPYAEVGFKSEVNIPATLEGAKFTLPAAIGAKLNDKIDAKLSTEVNFKSTGYKDSNIKLELGTKINDMFNIKLESKHNFEKDYKSSEVKLNLGYLF